MTTEIDYLGMAQSVAVVRMKEAIGRLAGDNERLTRENEALRAQLEGAQAALVASAEASGARIQELERELEVLRKERDEQEKRRVAFGEGKEEVDVSAFKSDFADWTLRYGLDPALVSERAKERMRAMEASRADQLRALHELVNRARTADSEMEKEVEKTVPLGERMAGVLRKVMEDARAKEERSLEVKKRDWRDFVEKNEALKMKAGSSC